VNGNSVEVIVFSIFADHNCPVYILNSQTGVLKESRSKNSCYMSIVAETQFKS
jgi:hypothetical protein